MAFPKQKVAIEVDGWAFHSDAEDFHIDRERQNNIALLGWQVLRFTWLDLTEYPQRVIAEIRISPYSRSARSRRNRQAGGREWRSTKNTSDTVISDCHPVSTAVAYVADEYIPNGNTAAHQLPARSLTLTTASSGIHRLATTHVTTVTGRIASTPASWM